MNGLGENQKTKKKREAGRRSNKMRQRKSRNHQQSNRPDY
jgi:hypothetical protein